jgi:transcriptional regulator
MKKVVFLVIAVLGMATVFAQSKAPIEFKEIKHSFGKIKQNIPASYTFTFKNTSNSPVVIESAVAGCGCTTPEYPKGVVAKGASEKIKVTYNAATMGTFTKTVTVKVAKVTDPIVLTIDGEVVDAKAATAKAKTGK